MGENSHTFPSGTHRRHRSPTRHSRAGGNPNPRLPLQTTTREVLECNPSRQPNPIPLRGRVEEGVKSEPPAPYNSKMGDFGREWEKIRKLPPAPISWTDRYVATLEIGRERRGEGRRIASQLGADLFAL